MPDETTHIQCCSGDQHRHLSLRRDPGDIGAAELLRYFDPKGLPSAETHAHVMFLDASGLRELAAAAEELAEELER